MFGRRREPQAPQVPSRGRGSRHGRRPIRSSLSGPTLPDPESRFRRFEADARAAVEVLQGYLPDELRGVRFGFQTAPSQGPGESQLPLLYTIDRASRSIVLYRMPIQRAKGLHVDDAEHRRSFLEYCVYRAVCEYLGADPWDLIPGRFDHY
ncbi:metallopeptidase family protein [Leucobacter musarum]|uniref:metallopeptidase family protein n=1 Tax=Leucobacter musarum TaxID=1930747 RepID=UPI0006A7866F|nr:metallopeptidase family protein [Leucobacter musarum]